jgi:hypothetical protein
MSVTDTASAAASLLMDLQVGGVSRFSVAKGAGAIFAANLIEQRNGVNAQAFNLYNTYTDASNYERFSMKWEANVFKFGNDNAGAGSSFRNIEFYRGGSKMITLTTNVQIDGGSLELTSPFTPWLVIPEDSTPPTSGTANRAIIFAEDNGSGKTRLMARFGTGAAVQIAIEP